MNAVEFLIKEHNKVRSLLSDIKDAQHLDTKKKRFELLAHDLIRHEKMEHEVWYPHFKSKLPDTVKHLVQEETHAATEIKKFNDLKTDESWNAHFNKFMHAVEHHAEEEEQELFPEVLKLLSKNALQDIGVSMAEYKRKYERE